MTSHDLQNLVLMAFCELKGLHVVNLDVRKLTNITDAMIICTGTSNRHVKAISDQVVEDAKKANVPILGIEGYPEAEWILIDLGDVVIHIMQAKTRDFYSLEKLWSIDFESVDFESADLESVEPTPIIRFTTARKPHITDNHR